MAHETDIGSEPSDGCYQQPEQDRIREALAARRAV